MFLSDKSYIQNTNLIFKELLVYTVCQCVSSILKYMLAFEKETLSDCTQTARKISVVWQELE